MKLFKLTKKARLKKNLSLQWNRFKRNQLQTMESKLHLISRMRGQAGLFWRMPYLKLFEKSIKKGPRFENLFTFIIFLHQEHLATLLSLSIFLRKLIALDVAM